MDKRILAEITACFNAFPQSRDTDKDVFMATVFRAVEGIEAEAIVRACQAFTGGEVQGQSLDFAPAVPRFAKVCRDMQTALEYSRLPRNERKPQPETNSPPCPPEKVQALADALAGKRSIQSVAEEYGIALASNGA